MRHVAVNRPVLWFGSGGMASALVLPPAYVLLKEAPPAGFAGRATAAIAFSAGLACLAGIASLCFGLGRAVRQQRGGHGGRRAGRAVLLAFGAAVPLAVLLVGSYPTWANRIVGLHWGLTIGGPFLLGLWTDSD